MNLLRRFERDVLSRRELERRLTFLAAGSVGVTASAQRQGST